MTTTTVQPQTVTLTIHQLKKLMDNHRHTSNALAVEVVASRSGIAHEEQAYQEIVCLRESRAVREEMQWILQQQGCEGLIK